MNPNAMHIYRDVKVRSRLHMYRIGFEEMKTELRNVALLEAFEGLLLLHLLYEDFMLISVFIMDRIFVI
jgi:hypothetical protein